MKKITALALITLVVSCTAIKTMVEYGTLDRRVLFSNESYKDEKLVLKINSFMFKFNLNEFYNTLSTIEGGVYISELDIIKGNNNKGHIELVQLGEAYLLNKRDTINWVNAYGINFAFDDLLKK